MAQHVIGKTHFAGLFELIQVCGVHRRDVSLITTQKGRVGTILIKDGELCDAVCGDLRGEAAIHEIFRWTDSTFELVPLRERVERTLPASNAAILIKAAEQLRHAPSPGFGPTDRMAGPLELLSPTELLQLFEINGRSALLKLKRDGETGYIHFRRGRVVHATRGRIYGDEAVLDLLLWEEGEFRIEFDEDEVIATVSASIPALVMEASRRLDVLTHLVKQEHRRRRAVGVLASTGDAVGFHARMATART